MRRVLVVLVCLLFPSVVWAQSAVQPYVVTGTGSSGQLTQAPVGGGGGGAVPMPVQSVPSPSSGATLAQTSTLASNLVVKATAGSLASFDVAADTTLSGAAWWIMIFNSATLPGDGTVTPAKCYAMPQNATTFSAAFTSAPYFATGIVIGVSTTGCFTKTASTHAFIAADYE